MFIIAERHLPVFQNSNASLTLIQQRSPVIKVGLGRTLIQKADELTKKYPSFKSQKDDFVKALVTFIKKERFSRVLLVAGVDAGMRQAQDFDK